MDANRRRIMRKRNIFFRYSDQAIIMHLFFYIPKKAWEGVKNSHIKNGFVLFYEPIVFFLKWTVDCMALSIRLLTKIKIGRLSTGGLSILNTLWIFTLINIEKTWGAYVGFFREFGLAIWAIFSSEHSVNWEALYSASYANADSEALLVMMMLFGVVSLIHLGCIYTGRFIDPDSAQSRGTSISYYIFGEKVPFLSERFYDIGWDVAAVIIIASTAFLLGDLTFSFFLAVGIGVIFLQESFESIDRSGMDV